MTSEHNFFKNNYEAFIEYLEMHLDQNDDNTIMGIIVQTNMNLGEHFLDYLNKFNVKDTDTICDCLKLLYQVAEDYTKGLAYLTAVSRLKLLVDLNVDTGFVQQFKFKTDALTKLLQEKIYPPDEYMWKFLDDGNFKIRKNAFIDIMDALFNLKPKPYLLSADQVFEPNLLEIVNKLI